MDRRLLRSCMRRRGLTRRQVARSLGMSVGRFNAKLGGTRGTEFSLGQLQRLRAVLELTGAEMEVIFFT